MMREVDAVRIYVSGNCGLIASKILARAAHTSSFLLSFAAEGMVDEKSQTGPHRVFNRQATLTCLPEWHADFQAAAAIGQHRCAARAVCQLPHVNTPPTRIDERQKSIERDLEIVYVLKKLTAAKIQLSRGA